MRCQTDGRLMTDELCRMGYCLGHRLHQPAAPTLIEFLLLRLGIYTKFKSIAWRLLECLSR